VFKTREDYLAMGIPRVLQVLRLMKEFPEYTFTLDQVCLVKPFLERYPRRPRPFGDLWPKAGWQLSGAWT